MSELVPARLRRRVRTAPAEPVLTWYHPASGARTELSAVTLLNWVDKTANLLDALDVGTGATVHLALAAEAPGHWLTAVWELACWQVGALVDVDGSDEPDLVVTGREWGPYTVAGVEVLACSLHPLGLPFAEPLPPPVLDYAVEVRSQPDSAAPVPQSGSAPAWSDPGRRLDQDALTTVPPSAGRRLVRAGTPWETARDVVLAPLLGGGSAVVVDGPVTDDQLERIRRDERTET